MNMPKLPAGFKKVFGRVIGPDGQKVPEDKVAELLAMSGDKADTKSEPTPTVTQPEQRFVEPPKNSGGLTVEILNSGKRGTLLIVTGKKNVATCYIENNVLDNIKIPDGSADAVVSLSMRGGDLMVVIRNGFVALEFVRFGMR
jgi:hypothetical protein